MVESTALLTAWEWRSDAAMVLGLLALAYVSGWRRLRARPPGAAGVWRLLAYLGGLGAIALALFSPVDALAGRLLALHMLQHELLTMVGPPLLLLADPLPAVLWGMPRALRERLSRLLAPGAPLRLGLRALTFMPAAWALYMVVLWAWHLPAAYEASLRNAFLHDLQHASFFLVGLVFWWPLVNPAPRVHGHIPHGFRLAYVIAAVLFGMLPGMIIAVFAERVLYPHYLAVSRPWGLTALEDQAIGWGLMGALDGLAYGIAFLLLVADMARREERRARLSEAIDLATGTRET